MTDQPNMKTVLFFREEGFYPAEHLVGAPYEDHALLNPGTLAIVDVEDGSVLWSSVPEVVPVGTTMSPGGWKETVKAHTKVN